MTIKDRVDKIVSYCCDTPINMVWVRREAERQIRESIEEEREACANLSDQMFRFHENNMEGAGEPEFSQSGECASTCLAISKKIRERAK